MFGFLKSKDDPAAQAAAPAAPRPSWSERLKAGLSRTRATLNTPLGELFSRAKIDDELLEELPYIERFFQYRRGVGYVESYQSGEVFNMIAA